MSKAKFRVYRSREPAIGLRFERRFPDGLNIERDRLRLIAQGLQKTGRSLADATPRTQSKET